MKFTVRFNQTDQRIPVKFKSVDQSFKVGFKWLQTATEYRDLEYYQGEYEVIPSGDEQILHTDGMKLDGDIRIKPIPNNYGKIVWDGITMKIV